MAPTALTKSPKPTHITTNSHCSGRTSCGSSWRRGSSVPALSQSLFTPDPSLSLTISSPGKALLRLPTPVRELVTPVIAADGSSNRSGYVSTRGKKCSGNCVLTMNSTEVAKTTYRFGPGRCNAPVITLLNSVTGESDIDVPIYGVKAKGLRCTRASEFTSPTTGAVLEWRYLSDQIRGGEKANVLALFKTTRRVIEKKPEYDLEGDEEDVPPPEYDFDERDEKDLSEKEKNQLTVAVNRPASRASSTGSGASIVEGEVQLAELVRSDSTRTPGTSRSTAGNGGLLVFSKECADVVEERLVVASCLVMLKKEVDRRRTVQMIALGGVAGGA